MNKVYQVFISSTYNDLINEQRPTGNTLAKAGFIQAGMELFLRLISNSLNLLKRIIDGSDYYVIIIGGRYRWLFDGKISYTEKEYEYALTSNFPILSFSSP